MSVKAMTWAWEQPVEGAKLLALLAIADCTDDSGVGFPGVDLLAAKTRIPKRSLVRYLNELADAGLLVRASRFRSDGSRTSSWLVLGFDLDAATAHFERLVAEGNLAENPLGHQVPSAKVALGDGDDQVPNEGVTKCQSLAPLVRPPTGDSLETSVEPCRRQADDAAVATADESSAEVLMLSHQLATRMLANDERAKVAPESPAWLEPIRLLLERDGRSRQEVAAVIDWCQADEFERSVVLSPGKLRKRFSELLLKSQRTSVQPQRSPGVRREMERIERRRLRLEADNGTCCAERGSGPQAAEDDWRRVAAALRTLIGDSTFDIWLADAHPHAGEHDELLLAVPEQVWGFVKDRFGGVLEQSAGRPVEIVVCELGGG